MIGFLLIDKPRHVTSFSCVALLRKILNEKKIGFAGTLDPLATGLMIFAIGKATKSLQLLQKKDKVYEVTIQLGAISDTYDADGQVKTFEISSTFSIPIFEQIEKLLVQEFLGEREQIPPIFSAIHIDGKRAYDLARRGETFHLSPRKIVFHELEILAYRWPYLTIRVHCSSGTYIRSLAYDIGQKLGCGGYVKELRRLKVGEYDVKNSISLEDENIFEPDSVKIRHFKKETQSFENLGLKLLPYLKTPEEFLRCLY